MEQKNYMFCHLGNLYALHILLYYLPSDILKLSGFTNQLYMYLAALPLAFSGFAAIGCFRASPYGGILKNYSKLTAKKSAIFFSKIQYFLSKTYKKKISNRSIRSEGDRFQTYKHPSAIYKGYINICIYNIYI